MKNLKRELLLIVSTVLGVAIYAQQPYFSNVNLTLTGLALKSELATKITNTHTNLLTYSEDWVALKQTDEDPSNSNNVLLLYGYNDSDGIFSTDRTRDKNTTDNGTATLGLWNREHTYAKSLATPSMSTSSPSAGTDAHHLRSCDKQMNSSRGSKKFATGSGNAGTIGANWYPGDEWKGDVARMMMYMYLRYPSQCPPNDVGIGTAVTIDTDMITLFLNWNAQDPVSTYEENRNDILETEQGNRNPFIDNPYLATIIWGGMDAEDIWNMVSIDENSLENSFSVYPVPAKDGDVTVYFKRVEDVNSLVLYNVNGQKVMEILKTQFKDGKVVLSGLDKGFYVLKANVSNTIVAKKIIVN